MAEEALIFSDKRDGRRVGAKRGIGSQMGSAGGRARELGSGKNENSGDTRCIRGRNL